jgi:tetratricopeptide (TPR) repeat protein
MKKILSLFLVLGSLSFANIVLAKKVSSKQLISNVFTQFQAGKYDEVISVLGKLQERIKPGSKQATKIQGLIYYWQAKSLAKMNDFEEAEKYFIKALELKYIAKDSYYEYGQVLYVASKYKRARIAFKKSVKRKYKVGVSLYYIAFISQELKDYKKAVSFYKLIEKLPADEKKDVMQAARMQVGDVYLKQIERQRDPFKGVKKYVIPQYEKALAYDEGSKLADEIRSKIINLQKKYEIILFKMRNGKPTARPPFYVKANMLYGMNDNVTSTSEDDKSALETKDYTSAYYQLGFFSRYSFYPNSIFSYAPEFSAQMTKYSSDSTKILPYNKYFIKTALKMNYEHIYSKNPATFYMDFDYTYNADDGDADEEFAASNNTVGATFSEELQLWKSNPSTFRFRYEQVTAEEETSSNSSISLTYEQIMIFKHLTLFMYNNYNSSTYAKADTSNANTLTTRLDFIFPTFYKLFNPTLYTSYTSTAYTNDSDKGTPALTSFGINLNRPVGENLYLTLDYGLSTQVADQDTDNYKQQLITLNLDLIY